MNTNNGIGHREPNPPKLTVLPAAGPDGRRDDSDSAQTQAKSDGARKIEQTIHYMMEHLNEPLQVARLAENAHTSPSHFFVLFKRWAGLSPIDYFIRLRMRQACRLLAATSLSVKEVAAVLGYDDPFYFSRVFKSVHGAPPTNYRLRMEEQEQGRGALAQRFEDQGSAEMLEQAKLPSARRMLSLR